MGAFMISVSEKEAWFLMQSLVEKLNCNELDESTLRNITEHIYNLGISTGRNIEKHYKKGFLN